MLLLRQERKKNTTLMSNLFSNQYVVTILLLMNQKLLVLSTLLKNFAYLVRNGCIKPDTDPLHPLRDFPPSKNLKQLKSVLGMFTYYIK